MLSLYAPGHLCCPCCFPYADSLCKTHCFQSRDRQAYCLTDAREKQTRPESKCRPY